MTVIKEIGENQTKGDGYVILRSITSSYKNIVVIDEGT